MGKRIAVLVETSHGSGRDLVRGVARFVRESASDWVIEHETQRLEGRPPSWLARWQGDGILARLHSSRVAEAVVRRGVPVIDVLDALPLPAGVESAYVDDAAISQLAFEHLHSLGLRQFCYLGPSRRIWAQKRRDGFLAAAAVAGLPVSVREFARTIHTHEPAGDCAGRLAHWLGRLPRPLGLMAANDTYAWLATTACREAGLAVPEHVAIIGVDNDEVYCSLAQPPLSSVITNNERLGYEAARRLAARMAGAPASRRPAAIVKPIGIHARASTDTLAIDDEEIAAALRLIRDHAIENLTVSDLAEAVGLAGSTLQRRFRAAVGLSVHEACIRRRLEIACRLLAETNLSLVAVAHRAGVGHQQNLGRLLRQRLGLTPAAYRQQARAGHPVGTVQSRG